MALLQDIDSATAMRVFGIIRTMLIVLFAAIIGLLVARLFWLIVEPEGSVSQIMPVYANSATAGTARTGQVDINLLYRDNPFGDIELISADIPDAPETTLDLRLVGLRAATVDAEGAAIIVTPDNRQNLYAPGDKILNNVYLDRVLTDRVILKKNGTLESLFRDNREGQFLVIGGEEPRQVPIEAETGRQRQIMSRQAFMENVRITPASKDNSIIGYQLSSRSDRDMFEQSGLKDGDIVTVLNGLRIADLGQEELITQFGAANELDLEVIRGEESVSVLIAFATGNKP